MRLIRNTRPNADVIHAVVQERASEPGERDSDSIRANTSRNRSTPQVRVNCVAGHGGVRRDGIGERITPAIVEDAVPIALHRSRSDTQVGRLALNGVLSGLVDFRFQQEAGNEAFFDQRLG